LPPGLLGVGEEPRAACFGDPEDQIILKRSAEVGEAPAAFLAPGEHAAQACLPSSANDGVKGWIGDEGIRKVTRVVRIGAGQLRRRRRPEALAVTAEEIKRLGIAVGKPDRRIEAVEVMLSI
jgi:hypothetical protein